MAPKEAERFVLQALILAVAVLSFGLGVLLEVAVKIPVPLKIYLIIGGVSLALGLLAVLRSGYRRGYLVSVGVHLLALALLYWIPWSPRKPFIRAFERIEPGMTAQEAKGVMAGYEFGEVGSQNLRFRHSLNDSRFASDFGEVYLEDGRVSKTEFLPD